jgi:hypothetical protein
VGRGQGDVSGLVCDSVVVDVLTSRIAPKLSGSLFGVSKGVNGNPLGRRTISGVTNTDSLLHGIKSHAILVFDIDAVAVNNGIGVGLTFTNLIACDLLELLVTWFEHNQWRCWC